jgi:hypothetical protein
MENLRFRVFKKYAKPDDMYSHWNYDRIKEWAEDSGRMAEVIEESRNGWQFPILMSEDHYAKYDAWLRVKYPVDEDKDV